MSMTPSSMLDKHTQKGQPFHVKYRDLINRMMFLIGALMVFRLGVHIPLPGIDNAALATIFEQQKETFIGLFNMFSGGALERMSIFALGIMPYITASIIIQLVTSIVPSLEALKKEGEQGRRKINKYTRYLTLLIALGQSSGLAVGMVSQNLALTSGFAFYLPVVTSLVAGTMFLMWLGEQITERGIGNGISIIIVAGIVSTLPSVVMQNVTGDSVNLFASFILALVTLSVLVGIVFIEKAQRRVAVNYAQKQQGQRLFSAQQTHLPFKINMAGVIPVIFASSLLMIPASLGQWLGGDPNAGPVKRFLQDTAVLLGYGEPLYIVIFAALIVFFCYFYSALMFSPKEISENLKRSGAYVPGIRPGEQTARYLDQVLNRLTFIGAIYITAICVLPMILQNSFGISAAQQIQGTSLLIVVVVIMDFILQLQSHLTSHQYSNQTLMRKNTLLKD